MEYIDIIIRIRHIICVTISFFTNCQSMNTCVLVEGELIACAYFSFQIHLSNTLPSQTSNSYMLARNTNKVAASSLRLSIISTSHLVTEQFVCFSASFRLSKTTFAKYLLSY